MLSTKSFESYRGLLYALDVLIPVLQYVVEYCQQDLREIVDALLVTGRKSILNFKAYYYYPDTNGWIPRYLRIEEYEALKCAADNPKMLEFLNLFEEMAKTRDQLKIQCGRISCNFFKNLLYGGIVDILVDDITLVRRSEEARELRDKISGGNSE